MGCASRSNTCCQGRPRYLNGAFAPAAECLGKSKPRWTSGCAACATTWDSPITRPGASSVPLTRSEPDCYPCLRNEMGTMCPVGTLRNRCRLRDYSARSASPLRGRRPRAAGVQLGLRTSCRTRLVSCRGFARAACSVRAVAPKVFVKSMPAEGFEPPTYGLQNRCTTTVLSRQWRSKNPGSRIPF